MCHCVTAVVAYFGQYILQIQLEISSRQWPNTDTHTHKTLIHCLTHSHNDNNQRVYHVFYSLRDSNVFPLEQIGMMAGWLIGWLNCASLYVCVWWRSGSSFDKWNAEIKSKNRLYIGNFVLLFFNLLFVPCIFDGYQLETCWRHARHWKAIRKIIRFSRLCSFYHINIAQECCIRRSSSRTETKFERINKIRKKKINGSPHSPLPPSTSISLSSLVLFLRLRNDK